MLPSILLATPLVILGQHPWNMTLWHDFSLQVKIKLQCTSMPERWGIPKFATKLRPFRASDKADKYRVITRLIRGYKPPVTNFFLRHWYGLFHPIYSWFLGHLVHWFFRVTSIQLEVPLDWWSTAGTNSGRTSVTGHPGGLVILELQSLGFGLDNSDFLRMSSILKYPEVWFPFFLKSSFAIR